MRRSCSMAVSGDFAPPNWTEYTGTYFNRQLRYLRCARISHVDRQRRGRPGVGVVPTIPLSGRAIPSSCLIVGRRSFIGTIGPSTRMGRVGCCRIPGRQYLYNLSSATGNTQRGLAQVDLNAGDTFGFYIDPTDNMFGGAELTISEIPKLPALTLVVPALIAIYLRRRRR